MACDTLSCKELESDLMAILQTKLVNLSAFAILIYDYVLTFADEKELIWGLRIRWGTALFLSIRYLTLIFVTFIMTVLFTPSVSKELCTSLVKFQWFAGVIVVMLAEVTLQARIHAMYGKSRNMLYFLIFTFVVTFGVILSFIIRIVAKEDGNFFKISPTLPSICIPLNIPGYFDEAWVPLFIHELILCMLAVYKGIESIRYYNKTGFKSRFVMFLVADSVVYYFAVCAVFFSLELVWVIKGLNYIELPFGHAVVIGSIMCQRLLLKIKRRYYSQSSEQLVNGRGTCNVRIDDLPVHEEYSMSTFRAE